MTVDVYTPIEQSASEVNEADMERNNASDKKSNEIIIHKTNKAGFFEKIKFYLSSTETLMEFLKMVSVWFVVIFTSALISTFFSRNVDMSPTDQEE